LIFSELVKGSVARAVRAVLIFEDHPRNGSLLGLEVDLGIAFSAAFITNVQLDNFLVHRNRNREHGSVHSEVGE